MGYHRSNGRVGTQNIWLVVPMVFCENRNLAVMREAIAETLGKGQRSKYESLFKRMAYLRAQGASKERWLAEELELESDDFLSPFPNVDGVKFLLHGLGCGGTRDDANALCGLLAGYITHPNVAGATGDKHGGGSLHSWSLSRGGQSVPINFDATVVRVRTRSPA